MFLSMKKIVIIENWSLSKTLIHYDDSASPTLAETGKEKKDATNSISSRENYRNVYNPTTSARSVRPRGGDKGEFQERL